MEWLKCSIVCLLNRILDRNAGVAPLTYKRFQRILARMDPPPRPVDAITSETIGKVVTPMLLEHDDRYGVPTLEDLGKKYTCDDLQDCYHMRH